MSWVKAAKNDKKGHQWTVVFSLNEFYGIWHVEGGVMCDILCMIGVKPIEFKI